MTFQTEDWPIRKVRPYANNPRVLRNAAEKVADSIREFGWRQPIVVDEAGEVIIGHARLAAAQLLKLKTVPVHVARGLAPEKVRALRIADNKTAEFAEWDDAKLADELAAVLETLGDLGPTGFSRAELEAIELRARAEIERLTAPPPPPPAAAPASGPEAAPEAPLPTREAADGPDLEPTGAGTGPADPPAADLVPFHALLTAENRAVVLDAVAAAKRKHDLETTGDALLVIARAYLHA